MPSLYETTVNTGEVASSNFTTLYNASGLAVPNAGAGQITGNLNVGGNLTVQGTSLLIGDVTLQSTLSLPNYTFPVPDGTTDQVLTTDGNGNLFWIDVTAIPGAAYNIEANTAVGGANLTLVDTAGGTDSVKFAAGRNMTIVRTDANTITVSTDADNIPDGTANGQLLVWESGAWTATTDVISQITPTDTRPVFHIKSNAVGVNNALYARKDYGATPYTTNDGTGIAFQLDSDTQNLNQFASVSGAWNSTAPVITLATNINNNTAGPFLTAASFSTDQSTLSRVRATTTGVTPHYLGVINNTVTNNGIGVLTVEAQSTGTPAIGFGPTILANCELASGSIPTIGSIGWEATDMTVGSEDFQFFISAQKNGAVPDKKVYVDSDGNVSADGNLTLNYDNTAADSYIYMQGTKTEYLKWDNTLQRFQLSDDIAVAGTYTQSGLTIRMNDGNTASTSGLYFNTTENLSWDPTNTRFEFSDQLYISQTDIPAKLERRSVTADISPYEQKSALQVINRVTDAPNNDTVIAGPCVMFTRTSGATDPTERRFATMGSAWNGSNQTASLSFNWSNDNFSEPTPGNFPGTYTLLNLDSGHANFLYNSIYVDYSTNGAAKIGINKNAPAYTLDVNGDANVSGDITVSGVKLDLATPVHQGQLLYVSNDVTPTITNSSNIIANVDTYRPVFQYDNSSAGSNGALFARKNYGATPFTIDDGTHIGYQVKSDTQPTQQLASIGATYQGVGVSPSIFLATNSNANTSGPFVTAASFSETNARVNGDLQVDGGDITTIQTTASLFNTTATTVNIANGASTVNLATSGIVNVSRIDIDARTTTDTATLTTTSTGTPLQFITTTRNAMTVLVYIVQGTNVHTVNATLLRTGTSTAMLTTYGELYNNISLANFTADVSSGNLRLLVNPTSATSTTFTAVRTSLS